MNNSYKSRERVEQLKKEYYKSINTQEFQDSIKSKMKQDVFGPTPPNLLVGNFGWPSVNWGPLISMRSLPASPREYYNLEYSQIIQNFTTQLQGKTVINVHSKNKILVDAQDSVMSIKPVDVEMNLSKKPYFKPNFDKYIQPIGATAPLDKYTLVDNPKIPKKVDTIVNEDMLSITGISELNNKGYDNYYLTKLLTAGLFGKFANRKMVPTKWGITATDDILGKQLIDKIRYNSEISEYWLFENEFLHNKFFVIMIPGRWEYEQFEAWPKHSPWGTAWGFNQEYEPWKGRTKYAESQAGGYYAARLPVCEYLDKIRKQARVMIIREIYDDYAVPVGVWQVRENVRHAVENKPKKFASRKDLFEYLRPRLQVKVDDYMAKSKIVTQKRLTDYFI